MMYSIYKWLLLIFLVTGSVRASEVADQPQTLTAYQQNWQQCNHHLVRKGIFFKIADIDWFSKQCNEHQDILTTTPVLLRFTYMRDIKREFFIDSATEYFLRNLNKPKVQQGESIITAFNQSYQDVTEGDVYDLLIDTNGTLKLFKNKQLLNSTQQPLIRNNYFKIWFGQDPVLPDLKDAFKPSI